MTGALGYTTTVEPALTRGAPGTAGSSMTTMLTTLALALIGGAQVVYGVTWEMIQVIPRGSLT